jgi:hypothetical protein
MEGEGAEDLLHSRQSGGRSAARAESEPPGPRRQYLRVADPRLAHRRVRPQQRLKLLPGSGVVLLAAELEGGPVGGGGWDL